MEKALPLQNCWMAANKAHVKPADSHILLLNSISRFEAVGIQPVPAEIPHSCEV